MKKRLTLRLDSDLVQRLKSLAAEKRTSVRELLADYLASISHERKSYIAARTRALKRLRHGFALRWTPPRSRDELHLR